MSEALPGRPPNSSLTLRLTRSGFELGWPAGKRSWLNLLPAAFLCFWLCGWAAGEIFALSALFGMGDDPAPLPARLFLLVWVAGWTYGGAMAIWQLYLLVGPSRRGRLEVTPRRLILVPERPSADSTLGALRNRQRNAGDSEIETPLGPATLATPASRTVYERTDAFTPVLVGEGDDTRLLLVSEPSPEVGYLTDEKRDAEADDEDEESERTAIEIAPVLPAGYDRLWLREVIQAWKSNGTLRIDDAQFGTVSL